MMKLIKTFWQKAWWSKIVLLVSGFFFLFAVIGILSPKGRESFKEGLEVGEKTTPSLPTSPATVTPILTPTLVSSLTPELTLEPSPPPTPTLITRSTPTSVSEDKMGSTPDGVEFYKKVDSLHKKGIVNGELYTEFESDSIVDVNPEMYSVQLGLKYSSITEKVDEQDKALILEDFYIIKNLAEQDQRLIDPRFGTLNYFVITFHDVTGGARGDLTQSGIDLEPQWMDWK